MKKAAGNKGDSRGHKGSWLGVAEHAILSDAAEGEVYVSGCKVNLKTTTVYTTGREQLAIALYASGLLLQKMWTKSIRYISFYFSEPISAGQ